MKTYLIYEVPINAGRNKKINGTEQTKSEEEFRYWFKRVLHYSHQHVKLETLQKEDELGVYYKIPNHLFSDLANVTGFSHDAIVEITNENYTNW